MQSACVHFAPTDCVLAAAEDVLAGLFLRVPLPDASFAIARAFSNALDMRTNPKLSRAPSWTLVVYKLDWLIHQLHLYYVLRRSRKVREKVREGKVREDSAPTALFYAVALLALPALLTYMAVRFVVKLVMCMVVMCIAVLFVTKLVKSRLGFSPRRDQVIVLITGVKGVKGVKGWQVRATSAHTRSGELATRPCLGQPLKIPHTLPSL